MDYKYIELERQIKSLMNKNFVVTSTRSKSAEELSNGSCQLYIDTIQKYFIFKVSGLSESICINPLTYSLLNVKYINGVDVSNLCSGISAGYGINIENLNDGVFKINVKENMFALKNEVDEVNDKFSNYYTKTECEDEFVKVEELNEYETLVSNTYSTKTELTNALANHYTKTETDAKYNTITDFNTYKTFVTNNYSTKTDVATDLLDYYTKTETDNKFALKTEIGTGGDVDLSNYYTKAESDNKYTPKNDVYEKEQIDELIQNLKNDCKNKYVIKAGEYPIEFVTDTSMNGYNYQIHASYGETIHIKALYNGQIYEVTTELVKLDPESDISVLTFTNEFRLGIYPSRIGWLRLYNAHQYEIIEINLFVAGEDESKGEGYELIPYYALNWSSLYIDFKLQAELTEKDTLRFKGYYLAPTNTFTYEAVMEKTNGNDNFHIANELKLDSGEILNQPFAVNMNAEFPILRLTNTYIVFTSIDKKASQPMKTTYEEKPFEQVQENIITFDGAIGDRVKIDFKFKYNSYEFSIDTIVDKKLIDVYSGVYINDSNMRYNNIGQLMIDESLPGKLLLGYQYTNFEVISVSKPIVSVDEGENEYYLKNECDERYAPKIPPNLVTIFEEREAKTASNNPGGGGTICIFKGEFGEYFKVKGTMNGKSYEYEGLIGNTGDSDSTEIKLDVSVPGELIVRSSYMYRVKLIIFILNS